MTDKIFSKFKLKLKFYRNEVEFKSNDRFKADIAKGKYLPEDHLAELF